MADIKFYDFEFNLIHIEPFAESANFTVKFCGEGSFELHFPNNFPAKRELLENFDIQSGKGICVVCGNRSGMVTGMRFETDFAVYGKTCDFILRKKVVLPFENLELYNPHALCAYFIGGAFADSEDVAVVSSADAFEDIFSEPIAAEYPKTLYDTVREILSGADLGYSMKFDTALKKWTFEVLNTVATEKKFICDAATAYDIAMTFDTKNYFSHILSKNDDGKYEFTQAHEGTGLYRWETISRSDEDLLCDLNFKFMHMKFEKDYFLGDKFKIFTENGIFSVAVSEISLSCEGDILSENPKLTITKEEKI